MNQALEKVFKPYIEEKTKGEIKVQIFPSAQLGRAPDMLEAVKMGSQDIFVGGIVWYTAWVPKAGLIEVPFMFNEREHHQRWVEKVMNTEIQQEVIKKGNQRFINLRGVRWDRGPFRVIASRKPIFTPEDLKGLKLRVWPSRVVPRAWKGFGCDVRTIDWSEVYLALQQGVVDAVTTPIVSVYNQKFTEVVKYVTELRDQTIMYLFSINEDVWQRLTKEQKQIIIEAKDEAGRWYNSRLDDVANETIERIIKEHNAYYIKVNRKPFIDIAHNKIVPDLVSAGLIKEEWVREVERLR